MPGIGWSNPLPAELGGGASPTERVHRAMRSLVGIGGAGQVNGLEDLWRQAKAYGISAALDADERAGLQFFPSMATDALPYYESLLAVPLAEGLETHERQKLVSERFTAPPATSHADVEAGLLAIDPRLSILPLPAAEIEATEHGRAFEDLAATEPFGGGRESTRFPNFSTSYVLTVQFAIGAGIAPSLPDGLVLSRAADYLNEALPAWETFQVVTVLGFNLDIDLLDLTALNP